MLISCLVELSCSLGAMPSMSSLLTLLNHRRRQIRYFMCCILAIATLFLPFTLAHAASHPKPMLTLNVQQGPLGVVLTVKGKNFHAGWATLKYVDAQHTSGMFAAAGENSVQVRHDGTFTATNLVLPNSGPAGVWNIVATDSAKTVAVARYLVLAGPGEQSAVAPSIILNPITGKAGDVIAVSGSNWLPQGTRVGLAFLNANNTSVMLNTSLVSDKSGMITGAIRVPSQFNGVQTSMTIVATDTTGALRAQTALTILSLSPTPVLSPTPTKAPSVSTSSTASPNDPNKLSFTMSTTSLELVLLVVGATLGLAALMLILFLIPWGKPKPHEQATIAHKPYRR